MKEVIQVMTNIDTIFTNTANSIRQKKNKTDKIKFKMIKLRKKRYKYEF